MLSLNMQPAIHGGAKLQSVVAKESSAAVLSE
jgi:hypothetical protein